MANKRIKIYTVSELNSLIKVALEDNLPGRVTVTGQISDWKVAASRHAYFDLKDENGQMPCTMWASKLGKIKFTPENGMAVLATGHIDVYLPRGKYQFYIDKLEPAGVGTLQLAFEQMVRKLQAEGLFDDSHKKPLPPWPSRIGIITSESGAAIHDITDSIYNRWPAVKLFLYPTAVQGKTAAKEIAAAIKDVNQRNTKLKLDVLIVGRGGGSMEDLWAFNEELLARAIFRSKIPVISAVGHEVDTTIADLVADARASTPTKAGVIAVPDMAEVLGQLSNIQNRLSDDLRMRMKLSLQKLKEILASVVFRRPLTCVLNAAQKLDETEATLADAAKDILTELKEKLSVFYEQVIRIEPSRVLGQKTIELNNLTNTLLTATEAAFNKRQLQLTAQENRLGGLNPKSVLNRGYSITTNKKTRRVVTCPV